MFARQAYQWINRVQQKFNALAELKLSPEKQGRLKAWLEEEFIYFTLLFEGGQADRDECRRALQAASGLQAAGELRPPEDLLYRYRIIAGEIASQGAKAGLSPALLLRLNEDGEFRKGEGAAASPRGEHLPMIVENACRWFAMESFAELNPVEQAAIALLRLLELAPFARNNRQTALLAASLFTLRRDLPPIIFRPQQHQTYLAALQEGLRMNTQPMVELVAEAIEQTLDEMLRIGGAER
jgi:hypothetical protein